MIPAGLRVNAHRQTQLFQQRIDQQRRGDKSNGRSVQAAAQWEQIVYFLALASMAIGIYFTFIAHPAEAGLHATEQVGADVEVGPRSPAWLMPAAVGVAIAGILLAWLTYQRRAINPDRLAAAFGPIRSAALARFWIDDILEGAYRIVLLGLSRIVGWVDRYIVDGVLNVASAWTLDAGNDMRSIQTGRAQDYVYAVALGVLALLVHNNFGPLVDLDERVIAATTDFTRSHAGLRSLAETWERISQP